jgi:hypothetical protein
LVGRVIPSQRNVIDPLLALPLHEAVLQVAFHAGSTLIALLGSLGEQLHHYLGERRWNL